MSCIWYSNISILKWSKRLIHNTCREGKSSLICWRYLYLILTKVHLGQIKGETFTRPFLALLSFCKIKFTFWGIVKLIKGLNENL